MVRKRREDRNMATNGLHRCLFAFYIINSVFIVRSWAQTAVGPTNLTGRVGDTPIFTCSGNPTDTVTWSFFNPAPVKIWSSPNSMFADQTKYSVKASDGGMYSLMINNAKLTDAGTYSCDRSTVSTHFYANLVIIDNPEAEVLPPLSSTKSMGLKVGDVAQLTCRVQYGAPTAQGLFLSPVDNGPQDPQFKMFLGNEELTPKTTVQSACTPNTPLCFKILTLNYTIEAGHHNDSSRRDRGGNMTSSTSTTSPTASTTTIPTTTSTNQSTPFSTLWNQTNQASSTISPSNQTMINGPIVFNNDVISIDPSKHARGMGHVQKRLYCEVMNSVYFAESSADVDVRAPVTRVWMDHPDGVVYSVGHKDYCFANGYPVPKVSWLPVYDNLTASDGQVGQSGNASLTPTSAGRHRWNCTASNEMNSVVVYQVFEFDVIDLNATMDEAKSGDDSVGLGVGLGLGLGIPILLGLVILVLILMKRRKRSQALIKKEVPPPYVASASTRGPAPIYKAPAKANKRPETKNGVPTDFVNPNPDPTSVPLLREPAGGVHPMGRNSPGFGDLGVKQITGTVPMLDESFNSNTNRSFDNDRAHSNGNSGYPSSNNRHRSDL